MALVKFPNWTENDSKCVNSSFHDACTLFKNVAEPRNRRSFCQFSQDNKIINDLF
jgi:hypothetical protein